MGELIKEIMIKACEVNKDTKHTVFITFMGHVEWFNVQIYLNGWKENEEPDINKEIYLDKKYAISDLKFILKELEELEE